MNTTTTVAEPLGSALIVAVRGKSHAVTDAAELAAVPGLLDSPAAVRRLSRVLEPALAPMLDADGAEVPELLVRIVWSKPTRRYPARPTATLVRIVNWDWTPRYAVDDRGEQYAKSTLYRMPRLARIADVFARRSKR